MRLTLLLILVSLFCVSSCVVYPTSRTYFEPNPSDGVPSPSMSCGYHRASKDSLVREIGDLHIQVMPNYKEGSDLNIVILFQSKNNNVKVSPSSITMNVGGKRHVLPSSTKENYQKPRSNWPFHSYWYYITYPLQSDNLDSISVVFNTGSVLINDVESELAPFRFSKTKKTDIYYASINC